VRACADVAVLADVTVLVETPFIIVVLSSLRTVPGEAFP
jgi:hypothetical protein